MEKYVRNWKNLLEKKEVQVYVGRKHLDVPPTIIGWDGRYGNPFVIGKDGTREEVVAKYRNWLYQEQNQLLREDIKQNLKNKILGCWCSPLSCHASVLAELANHNNNEKKQKKRKKPEEEDQWIDDFIEQHDAQLHKNDDNEIDEEEKQEEIPNKKVFVLRKKPSVKKYGDTAALLGLPPVHKKKEEEKKEEKTENYDVAFYVMGDKTWLDFEKNTSEYEQFQNTKIIMIAAFILQDKKKPIYQLYCNDSVIDPIALLHESKKDEETKYEKIIHWGWIPEFSLLLDHANRITTWNSNQQYGMLRHSLGAEQRMYYWRHRTFDLHEIIKKEQSAYMGPALKDTLQCMNLFSFVSLVNALSGAQSFKDKRYYDVETMTKNHLLAVHAIWDHIQHCSRFQVPYLKELTAMKRELKKKEEKEEWKKIKKIPTRSLEVTKYLQREDL